MSEANNDLKKAHPMSLKGIFNEYTISKIILSRGTLLSLIVSLIIVIGLCVHNKVINEFYNTLIQITDIILSLLPNLLGFCIGGYALIIGACNTETIKKMSVPQSHNLSLFQILSSVFAATLILQCFTLVMAYIIHFCLLLELNAYNVAVGLGVNVLVIFILLFFSFISLSLLYYTIINIFNLGQTMHFCVRLDNEKEIKNNETKEKINDE